MYRTGEVVFAQLSYEWKIKRQLLKGSAPARLLRFFMWDDEEDASQGEKRLMVEQAWLWNHDTIMTVPGAEEVIPATIIHMLREDPKKYLQGDLMTCEDFETMLSDATCYRHSEEWAMPEADVHAFIIVGAVEFDISQEDGTVVNRVKTFAPWASSKTLLESTPAAVRAMITRPAGVQPCDASDHTCRVREVPLAGGPELPHLGEGETLKVGANDARIFAFEYLNYQKVTKRAYAYGDPTAEPLQAIELLTHHELASSSMASEATLKLTKTPRASRVYLSGNPERELVATRKLIKVKRDQITKLIIVATPALLEGLQLHYAPECIFSFELTLSNAGDLVACTRLSESMALHLTRVTIMPNVMSRRLFVLYTLRETIMERELRAGLAVWPMKFTMKFPFEWLMAIPGLAKWRRSSKKRSVMVRIFEDDADAEETLGFSAWHAPKGKDVFRYAKISVPPPKASVMAPPTTSSRRSSELNYIEYDTETQLLVGFLNITHFIGHKRVGGAPVDPQNKRAKTGEVFKLGAGWVKEGERAPTQAALLRSFPGAPPWASFD